MENNRVEFDVGPQPGQVPLVGREVPVYTIDEAGPDPAQLWKKLCVVLICFIIFLVFMLVLKSFHC